LNALSPAAIYETDSALAQYCDAHYGVPHFGTGNFSVRCVTHTLSFMTGRPMKRALDLGCAVGRASFELAKTFAFVTGLDFSARFIQIAVQLREKGVIHYALAEEGELFSYHEKRLSDLGLDSFAGRVEFFQADAINLNPQFTNYDLILAANLIDRLYDPGKLLATIHERLNPGGLLVLTSPYTWLEEFTRRDNWIGGFKKNGEPYTTLQGLRGLLQPHFKMLGTPKDIEFVIRETARKFQHTISQATLWERVL
jgi:putative 4-mercaptohistidine N1-methyltranferase